MRYWKVASKKNQIQIVKNPEGLPDVIQSWLSSLNGGDVTTRRTYASAVLTRGMPIIARLGGAPSIRKAEASIVMDILRERYSEATVNLTVSALSSLWQVMIDREIVRENPFAHVRRRQPKVIVGERLLSHEEVLAVVAGARTQRDKVLLRLLYVTGARVSEIVRPRSAGPNNARGLRWRDVRRVQDGATVTLFGKGSKTRAVWIPSPLSEDVWNLSRTHRPNDAIFPVTRVRAWQIIKDAAKRANVTEAVSPHWLRHSHGVESQAQGAPINVLQAQLGHARLETTGIYTRVAPGHGTSAYVRDPGAR